MKTIPVSSIELLEARIAPATIGSLVVALNKTSATYTDVDGDVVTVKVSAGDLTKAVFTGVAVTAGHDQLQTLDLTGAGAVGDKATLTFSVKKATTGNGLANVGYINATGHDLGAVTVKGDLGQIDAGDATVLASLGIKSLAVNSMGHLNTDTQDATDTHFGLESDIIGGLGSLTVTHDVQDAFINVTALGTPASGTIGTVKIGGSLIGHAANDSGEIQSSGKMGAVTITEDLRGGSGSRTGMLNSGSDLGAVSIGGSIIGGSLASANSLSGAILSVGNITSIKVAHDVVFGSGSKSGYIQAGDFSITNNPLGKLGSLTIGGSLIGNATTGGTVESANNIGPIKIGGSVVGGLINSAKDIGTVSVGGSLLAGSTYSSGVISCGGNMGMVSIGHDIQGTSVLFSGLLFSVGNIAGVKVGGSILGGGANIADGVSDSGGILANGNIGAVSVGHDIIGGKNSTTTQVIDGKNVFPQDLTDTGFVEAGGRITSVTVGGSIIAGVNYGTGTTEFSGAIIAGDDLGALTVKGSILGSAGVGHGATPVEIVARGQHTVAANATTDVAIGKITVTHRVENAQILAGYDFSLNPVNPDAQIGAVSVGGDWIASSLAAGAVKGGTGFGVGDTTPNGGSVNISSKIASIVIKGMLIGTPVSTNNGDQFGFVAEKIGSMKVSGYAITIPTNNTPVAVGDTTDTDIHIIP